ncbi:enoyl-CoA hydratase-related protein [Reichenbachiella carrageenanivorans]|uniref:Enoyl-CoA hydratase-related protein n=1 Tax=Reichenbachiella carrageenanivorans TaxID=2979869 RepID=A0ABY6D3D0_9BACT|nr:enoyl-CoA hydratase-related protein [Reichenbachiella carrageenanivorans]UXX80667.1 enoyl-CoA hydratase-related protein [Reichenbachiella carrageenanivorans]
MEQLETLALHVSDSILTITINRESALNALNQKTFIELESTIEQAIDNKEISGIIITGAGEKAFVAGADITELATMNEVNSRSLAEKGQEIFDLIEGSAKPVIAVVNGFALGGGCEMAMACHMRIATSNAKFGQPEVNLGVIPGYGGTQRLTQLVGKGKALELMLTGDMIGADEALSLRLINYKVDTKADAITKAEEILAKIQTKAPLAVGMVIECVKAVYTTGQNGYQTEANSFSRCCGTEDFKEGTTAFLEKRKPIFKGE